MEHKHFYELIHQVFADLRFQRKTACSWSGGMDSPPISSLNSLWQVMSLTLNATIPDSSHMKYFPIGHFLCFASIMTNWTGLYAKLSIQWSFWMNLSCCVTMRALVGIVQHLTKQMSFGIWRRTPANNVPSRIYSGNTLRAYSLEQSLHNALRTFWEDSLAAHDTLVFHAPLSFCQQNSNQHALCSFCTWESQIHWISTLHSQVYSIQHRHR